MMRQAPFQAANALYWVVFIGLVLALVSVLLQAWRPGTRTGRSRILLRARGHPGHGWQHVV
jgi:hypothetical protein